MRGVKQLLGFFVVLALLAWGITSVRGDDGLVPSAASGSLAPIDAPGVVRDVAVYDGLGTWVDVFDFDPATAGDPPPVTPDSVETMAGLGIRTLYLQAANDDGGEVGVVDEELVGEFVRQAHEAGVRVVGWYLPRFGDVARDLAFIEAMSDFEYEGHRLDGVALDIEWTQSVADHDERSARLLDLTQQARTVVGDDALGAIVLEPILVEDVNPNLWPGFPYAGLAEIVDVFLPMTYWTNRDAESGLRDAFAYTDENVQRLRERAGRDVPVHVIGGVGDAATPADYGEFARAAIEQDTVGRSVYDFNTTVSSAWEALVGD